jgi:hypothetical protein
MAPVPRGNIGKALLESKGEHMAQEILRLASESLSGK